MDVTGESKYYVRDGGGHTLGASRKRVHTMGGTEESTRYGRDAGEYTLWA